MASRRLKNVVNYTPESCFTFAIGNGRYWVPSVAAEFMSARVSECCLADSTIDEVVVDVDDPGIVFSDFLRLFRGKMIELRCGGPWPPAVPRSTTADSDAKKRHWCR
jgi:hypothetical protein